MREIKFRAWDKVSQKMCDVAELYKVGGVRLDVYDEIRDRIYQVDRGDIPIMQYTGLKDKNGREIYEGDIVAKSVPLFQPLGRGQRIDEVVWGRDDKNTGMWEMRLISDDRLKRNPENKVPYYEPFGLGCEPHNFEVIGNVYENPELINPND